jgi:hypothetical protein
MASDADDATIDAAVRAYVANDASEKLAGKNAHVAHGMHCERFAKLAYESHVRTHGLGDVASRLGK